jgi:hypothetical protein
MGSRCSSDDPFQGFLDDGKRDPQPLVSARTIRGFTPQDVSNLQAVVSNTGLATELRRAALEQLVALAADPRLLPMLEGHDFLLLLMGVVHR